MLFRPVALLLTAAATAAAQAPTLEPNTRIRVDLIDNVVVNGILTSQTVDSAFVWTSAARGNQAFAWSSIARVRVNVGSSAGAAKGRKVGKILGGIGGTVVGLYLGAAFSGGDAGGGVLALTGVGALGGTMLGALYGTGIGAIAGARQWKTVYPDPAARPR